jgi:hypothetical protein
VLEKIKMVKPNRAAISALFVFMAAEQAHAQSAKNSGRDGAITQGRNVVGFPAAQQRMIE